MVFTPTILREEWDAAAPRVLKELKERRKELRDLLNRFGSIQSDVEFVRFDVQTFERADAEIVLNHLRSVIGPSIELCKRAQENNERLSEIVRGYVETQAELRQFMASMRRSVCLDCGRKLGIYEDPAKPARKEASENANS